MSIRACQVGVRSARTLLPLGLIARSAVSHETLTSRAFQRAQREISSSNRDLSKARSYEKGAVGDNPMTALKLSGHMLGMASDNKDRDWQLSILDIVTDKNTWLVGHRARISGLAFHGDHLISASHDGTCRIWDSVSKVSSQTLNHGSTKVNCLQVEGHTLVTGTDDATASVWDLKTNKREYVLDGHTEGVGCLSIDSGLLATGSLDHTCRIWDVALGKCKRVLKEHTAPITTIQLSDDTVVTGSSDGRCISWNAKTGELLQKFEHGSEVTALQFEGRVLITAAKDGICRVWDLESGICTRELKGHERRINCLQMQDDLVATGSDDCKTRLWNWKTGEYKVFSQFGEITHLVLKGTTLITGNSYGAIVRFDTNKPSSLPILKRV
ncbi:MAG: WD40 repeat domain-containing protein [Chlamydiales bacterium]|nr:WD40 repeat domain-containing protein [Chlamydiales bacterium]